MKETKFDNPEIIIKDSRIVELDNIVSEVIESEEWEEVKMNILEYGEQIGLEKGRELERQQGKSALIASLRKYNVSNDDIIKELVEKYGDDKETARKYLDNEESKA